MATRHLLFRSTGNQLGDQQNTGQQQLVILKFVNDYSGDLELCSLSLLLPCCAFRVRKPFRTILLFQNWSINLGDVSRQLVPYAPYLAPQYSKLHWHLHFLPRKLKFDTNVAQCMGNRGEGGIFSARSLTKMKQYIFSWRHPKKLRATVQWKKRLSPIRQH